MIDKTCEDCVNGYPQQVWINSCTYFAEEYGTPCDKHMTEQEQRIKKLKKDRDDILQELKELYDSSNQSTTEEESN